ncbi:hypothetical protein [Roseivirga pacifica]|uniref:hypothetical protein n=1 Tax=Roseivirga pacifica TaxID=1267423 RepID=UPI00227A1D65|nr:hypothetical protein [Roseivirga pacifica]
MKTIQEMGVQEIDSRELNDTSGGYFFLIPVGIYLLDQRDRFVSGMKKAAKDVFTTIS